MSDISQIDGAAIRSKRESQGWVPNDLATRACLSVKQIRQIEEGGMSAFYSESVKLTAARKVAALLDMSEAQLFGQARVSPVQAVEQLSVHEATVGLPDNASLEAVPAVMAPTGSPSLSRSEALHVLAQPPEHLDEAPVAAQETAGSDEPVAPAPSTSSEDVPPTSEPPQAGSHWLKMLALFVVALAAAAVLQTQVLEKKPEASASDATPLPVPADSSAVMPSAQVSFEPAPEAASDASAGAAKPVSTEAAPSVVTPPTPPASSPAAGQ